MLHKHFFSYSLDPAHLPLSAESYDAVVYRCLTNIMTRKNDSRDTYIILRSDHGLQGERDNVAKNMVFSFNDSHLVISSLGGPNPIDFSTQVEHMHPWTVSDVMCCLSCIKYLTCILIPI